MNNELDSKEKRRIKITTVLSTHGNPIKLYAAQVAVIKHTWYGREYEVWETLYEQCDTEKIVLDFFKNRDFVSTTEFKYLK